MGLRRFVYVKSKLFTKGVYEIERFSLVENKEIHVFWCYESNHLQINSRVLDLLACSGHKIIHHIKKPNNYLSELKLTLTAEKFSVLGEDQEYLMITFLTCKPLLYYYSGSYQIDFYVKFIDPRIQISSETDPNLVDFLNSVILDKRYYRCKYLYSAYQICYIREHEDTMGTKTIYDLVLTVWARLDDEYEINFGTSKDWVCSGFTLPWYYYESIKPGETRQLDLLCLHI